MKEEQHLYYTPEEEEFSKGLDYQVYENFDIYDKPDWYPFTFGENGSNNPERMEYPFPIHNHRIRVKYLDEDDILDLGFTKTGDGQFEHTDKDYLNLESFSNHKGWYLIYGEEESQFGFSGWVKNKLELKKLMKSLNIK